MKTLKNASKTDLHKDKKFKPVTNIIKGNQQPHVIYAYFPFTFHL